MQFIGADAGLRALRWTLGGRRIDLRRHQLWRDLGLEDRLENCPRRGVDLPSPDDPPEQKLDQRLRNGAVDVVVGHVVANAIGRPAKREFTEIPRAEDERAVVVGETEEVRGPLTSLDVLEGDVVDGLPFAVGMADVAQHLQAGGADVEFSSSDPEGVHEGVGIGEGRAARREAGHGPGEDVATRKTQPIHCLRRNDQGMGRVEPPGDPDDQLLDPRALQPLHQAVNLDVVGLVTALLADGGVEGHVRKALDAPLQGDLPLRHGKGKGDSTQARDLVTMHRHGVAEGGRPHPVLHQPLEIKVGQQHLLLRREPCGLGQPFVVLVNDRLPIPGKVGRRLPWTGGGIEVGRDALSGLSSAEVAAIVGLADRHVARREVGEDRRPAQCREGAWRDR